MKRNIFILLIILILALATACSVYFEPLNKFDRNDPLVDFDISDPESEGASDEIALGTVTPNSGLINGDTYTFTIEVTYNLTSLEDGAVLITFNYSAVNSRDSPESGSAVQLVSNGADTITFTVEQTARDWGNDGDFMVAATLSSAVYDETEGSYSYNGIITDYEILTF